MLPRPVDSADRHVSGCRVIGKSARPHDGPVQRAAFPDRLVGNAFRAQIDLEDLVVGGGLRIGGHRGHHHVSPDACGFRRVGEQDGRVAVDGLLACRAAAGTRPRGEHDGVGADQLRGDLIDRGLLQVDDQRRGARGLQVRNLCRVPDESGDRVAPLRQQPLEDQRDLSVSACDDYAHALVLTRRRIAAQAAGRASGGRRSPRRSCRRASGAT